MYRHQVPPESLKQNLLWLESADAHHLLHVLRVKEGTEIGVFDGCGRSRLYHVIERTADGLMLEAKQPIFENAAPSIETILFACIPKGDRMDWMLEKATELGVTKIVPVMSERTVVRLDAKQAVKKLERWQRIVEAASRQCGTTRIPEITAAIPFDQTVPMMRACTTLIVAALIPTAQPLRPVLANLNPDIPGQTWGWWCGPEGDFTATEMQTILNCGAIPVTLGPLILRAETAAIYGMANLGCVRNAAQCLTAPE